MSRIIDRNVPYLTWVIRSEVGACKPVFSSWKEGCAATLESSLKFFNYNICQLEHNTDTG